MLKVRLERVGDFEVLASNDSEQGYKLAATERPDVILMDLEMSVDDRWEVVRRQEGCPIRPDPDHQPVRARGGERAREGHRHRVRRVRCQTDRIGGSGRDHSARRRQAEITHPPRWSGRRAAQQAHGEHRALARLARHGDVTAHHLAELSANHQPEPETSHRRAKFAVTHKVSEGLLGLQLTPDFVERPASALPSQVLIRSGLLAAGHQVRELSRVKLPRSIVRKPYRAVAA
jgi:hypothetical protein